MLVLAACKVCFVTSLIEGSMRLLLLLMMMMMMVEHLEKLVSLPQAGRVVVHDPDASLAQLTVGRQSNILVHAERVSLRCSLRSALSVELCLRFQHFFWCKHAVRRTGTGFQVVGALLA